MLIEMKELDLSDDNDILNMLNEIGPGENGYRNDIYNINYNQFKIYLLVYYMKSLGIGLSIGEVPETTYWLFINSIPVGIGKLRHYLNNGLRNIGGHIGYIIRPSERGKGYGNIILYELIKKAKEKNIKEILIMCNKGNLLSRKVIEANKGMLESINIECCRYWIRSNTKE